MLANLHINNNRDRNTRYTQHNGQRDQSGRRWPANVQNTSNDQSRNIAKTDNTNQIARNQPLQNNKVNIIPNSNRAQQRPSVPSRTSEPCFRCGELGHFVKECTNQKRIFCRSCGKRGVTAFSCPNCNVTREPYCTGCGLVGYTRANCPECTGNAE